MNNEFVINQLEHLNSLVNIILLNPNPFFLARWKNTFRLVCWRPRTTRECGRRFSDGISGRLMNSYFPLKRLWHCTNPHIGAPSDVFFPRRSLMCLAALADASHRFSEQCFQCFLSQQISEQYFSFTTNQLQLVYQPQKSLAEQLVRRFCFEGFCV
jgi:hypothetical protein